MQTILGAGGPIGTELAKALPEFANQIRLVCRHPKAVNRSTPAWSFLTTFTCTIPTIFR